MHRRSIQGLVTFLLLACGVLLSATIDHGTADRDASLARHSPLELPVFSVASGRGRLLLDGTTASAAHELGLLQLAADQFGGIETQTTFRPGVLVSDNWVATSTRLLYVLAAAESARAVMRDHSIEIRGVTTNAETFAARVEFLREELVTDTEVSTDVMTIKSAASPDALCERAFSQLTIEPVSFKTSSAEIRTASYGTLDRIIDFAYDCQRATIAVTGHTDASGDEFWNRRLSRARAQAVADYIAQGGIPPQRLLVTGLGSLQPIADNTTARGRRFNRRIEFELR